VINVEAAVYPSAIEARARKLRLLVLDVDGVLTDGRLRYGPDGESLKVFHVRDGLGIKLLQEDGIAVAVISGRRAPALERRLADLGVAHGYLGRSDKLRALAELEEATGVGRDAMAFMGDDVLDLPALRAVALPIAPADGHFLVRRELADGGWVTQRPGGAGAVREVADGLLQARGRLGAIVEAHLEARGSR
jgi:3-deoxy-D-manno-octulosonate 8-phosphate phosphatase (KDO 8-P phosphatase)